MQITKRQLQTTLRDLGLFNTPLAEAERDADLMVKWCKPETVIDRSEPKSSGCDATLAHHLRISTF